MISLRSSGITNIARVARFPCFTVVLAVCLQSAAVARDDPAPPRLQGIEGNWIIERTNMEEVVAPQVYISADAALTNGLELNSACSEKGLYRFCHMPEKGWRLNVVELYRQEDGSLRVQQAVPQVTMAGGRLQYEWGGITSSLSAGSGADAGMLRGSWHMGEKSGSEIWRRAPAPRITRVECISEPGGEPNVAADGSPCIITKKFSNWWNKWNDMRGNRPAFTIRVMGKNLWGMALLPSSTDTDNPYMEQEFRYIIERPNANGEAEKFTASDWANWGPVSVVRGVEFTLRVAAGWVEAGGRPGLKTLYLNGRPLPYELRLDGFTASTPKPKESTDKPSEDELVEGET